MMRRVPAAAAAILISAAAGLAVVPQKWTFRTADDFLRGKSEGVSVTSEGVLTLAPRDEKIEGPPEDFYLSFLMSPDGVAYLGTGHEGRVYKIGKDGKAELLAQMSEMDVTCLAMDRSGVLYAGTSPNGKIYKISAQGKAEEFFNPREKYIWNLYAAEEGGLLASVGEDGGIYQINSQGAGSLIFKARENHVLCLKLDRNRDIIAGTGGNGLVYRIARGGKASVIFETPFEEVRTLAFDLDGNIYAAAGGTPARAQKENLPAARVASRDAEVTIAVSAAAPAGGGAAAQVPPVQAPVKAIPTAGAGREGGALFEIAPDGTSKKLWSADDEMIYSLFWNEAEKRVVFGTGPKGKLMTVDRSGDATLVIQSNSEQTYELVPVGVRTYILANNPCSLSVLYPEMRLNGEYAGPVLDAGMISSWGRISWDVDLPESAICRFQTRSGNSSEPGPSWSDWSPPYQKSEGEPILSPKARFIQFKALLTAATGKSGPALTKTEVFYLQTNVPPVLNRLDVLPVNEVVLKLPTSEDIILGLERRTLGDGASERPEDPVRLVVSRRAQRKGYQTIQWDAEDPNGDTLAYTVSMRLEGEKTWRVLDDDWTETTYAFDTANFPDGIYVLKVTASDAPSNPRAQALSAERTSAAIVIDNTAPVVRNVRAVKEANGLNVSFIAEDAFSTVKEARVLVRPDDWRVVFPEDGICDAKSESFKFRVPLDARADGLLTIVVKDAAGNTAVVKQNF